MSDYITDKRILRGMESQLKLRQARLEQGDKSLGWKVGFGSPEGLHKLQIEAPLIGFLTHQSEISSGAEISVGSWVKPRAEPEIAVHIAKDLGAGATHQNARDAIAGLGMAIEIVDVDFPPDDVKEILTANIYNRNVIVGPPDSSRAGGVLDGLVGDVYRNGVKTATTDDLQALTGDLVGIVRHTANLLGMLGLTLSAGELIITGSIVPPLSITADEEIRFELDAIGSLSVNVVMTG